MAKRKTSESVRKMRLIILGLSVALIAAVVLATWFTLSRESQNGDISWKVASTTETSNKIAGEPDQTTTMANGGSDTQRNWRQKRSFKSRSTTRRWWTTKPVWKRRRMT